MGTKHAGKIFGHLTVLDGWVEQTASGNPKQIFKLRCSCGRVYTRPASSLLYAKTVGTQRCSDCAKRENAERSAKGYKHEVYLIWQAMVQRCTSPDAPNFMHYGGRGIFVCNTWLGARAGGEFATMDGFHNFLADMGERPSAEYTLDRKDNDGPYSPDNCRWATRKVQQNNKRTNVYVTFQGRTLTVTEWGEKLKHPRPDLWASRARAWGVPLEQAVELLIAHYPNPVGKWKTIFATAIKP